MNLGLLGAIGGFGRGLQQTGTSLFRNEMLAQREKRLQAIRDKEYQRARADALSDYDRARDDKLTDYKTMRTDAQSDLEDSRNYEQGQIRQILQEEGKLVGIKGNGDRIDLGAFDQGPQSAIGKFIDDLNQFEPGSPEYQSMINLYNGGKTDYRFFTVTGPDGYSDVVMRGNTATGSVEQMPMGAGQQTGAGPVRAASDDAIAALMADPSAENRAAFMARYKYLPSGL